MPVILLPSIVLVQETPDGLGVEVAPLQGSRGENRVDKFFAQFISEPAAYGDTEAAFGPAGDGRRKQVGEGLSQ